MRYRVTYIRDGQGRPNTEHELDVDKPEEVFDEDYYCLRITNIEEIEDDD